MNPFLRPALVVAVVLPLASHAASPGAPSGCTIVAGGGRTQSSSDSQINDRWNRLNFSFFDAAAEAVRANEPVEQAFFPVGSTDAAKNADAVLAQAAKAGCTRVAFVSVFGDSSKANPELVFSLRVSPIHREGTVLEPSAGATVGAVEYEKEYRFAATPASLDKVVPSRIADQAVRDYRASAKR